MRQYPWESTQDKTPGKSRSSAASPQFKNIKKKLKNVPKTSKETQKVLKTFKKMPKKAQNQDGQKQTNGKTTLLVTLNSHFQTVLHSCLPCSPVSFLIISKTLLTTPHAFRSVSQNAEDVFEFLQIYFSISLAIQSLKGSLEIICFILSRKSLLYSIKFFKNPTGNRHYSRSFARHCIKNSKNVWKLTKKTDYVMSQIETPLLKVPFESLKRAAKTRKSLVDDAVRALSGLSDVAQDSELTREGASEQLGTLAEKLNHLKRKLDEVSIAERDGAERSQARLKCLADLGEPKKDGSVDWNAGRMDRLLTDYFLRTGCSETAATLMKTTGLESLVDAYVFHDAYKVIEGLKHHDCSEALDWCRENKSRLKKIRSTLEFRLHLQVFVEHVRRNAMMEAIQYAKMHLAPWANHHMNELQHVVAVIAFRADTKCERYKELFEEKRWEMLLLQFNEALYRLNYMTSQSLLDIHLQAGLSALKTPQSFEPQCCQEDPLHLMSFQTLAEGLPFAKYDRSRLICSVTKECMNPDNPPKALPNGYVYSTKAIDRLAINGKITCPITGDVCEESEVRRVFIV